MNATPRSANATQPPSIQALEQQYFTLRSHKDAVLASCGDGQQKVDYLQAIADSRDNFYAGLRGSLQENDPRVIEAVAELHTTQANLDAALGHLAQIAAVLSSVTQALAAGSALVGLVTLV